MSRPGTRLIRSNIIGSRSEIIKTMFESKLKLKGSLKGKLSLNNNFRVKFQVTDISKFEDYSSEAYLRP